MLRTQMNTQVQAGSYSTEICCYSVQRFVTVSQKSATGTYPEVTLLPKLLIILSSHLYLGILSDLPFTFTDKNIVCISHPLSSIAVIVKFRSLQ